jgi:hypothetical protein
MDRSLDLPERYLIQQGFSMGTPDSKVAVGVFFIGLTTASDGGQLSGTNVRFLRALG